MLCYSNIAASWWDTGIDLHFAQQLCRRTVFYGFILAPLELESYCCEHHHYIINYLLTNSWLVIAQVAVRCSLLLCHIWVNHHVSFDSRTHHAELVSWQRALECNRSLRRAWSCNTKPLKWLLLSSSLPLPEAFHAFSCFMLACQTMELPNTLICRVCSPSGQHWLSITLWLRTNSMCSSKRKPWMHNVNGTFYRTIIQIFLQK